MLLRVYIFTAVFLFQLIAVAQKGVPASFTTVNGLPDDNVTCMLTDRQGFIWLGTLNGLCRFDGTHFYTFPGGTIQSNKIAGDIILDLEEDGDYVWVAHRFGLSRINKYSFECNNFQNSETGRLYIHRRSIRDIYKDSLGNIWLAGDHELLRFNKASNSLITMVDFEKIFRPGKNTQITKIIPAGGNQLLLFMINGWMKYNIQRNAVDTQQINSIPVNLMRGENLRLRSYWNTFLSNHFVGYNKETKSITFSNAKTPGAIGRVTNLYVDSNLHILVTQEQNLPGTPAANDIMSLQPGEYSSLSLWKQPFNFIQYSNGIMCWGSVRGLHVEDNRLSYLRRYFLRNNDQEKYNSVPDILDVNEYSNTEWLLATKGGLYLMDKATSDVSSFSRWKDSSIYKMLILPDKSVWLSTDKNLWHFNPRTQSTGKPIALKSYAVSINYFNNKLITATRNDGLMILNLNNLQITIVKSTDSNRLISSNKITAIKPIDTTGNFIVSYNDPPGIYSYINFETGKYKSDSIPLESYSFKEKFSLVAVQPGIKQLWIGSYLGGAYRYDSLSGSWKNFTVNEYFPFIVIFSC